MSDEKVCWTVQESPIGSLTLVAGTRGITNIHFDGHAPRLPEVARRPLLEAVAQLDAYFAGRRQGFELDLDLRGAPLQLAVWRLLLEIPYGETTPTARSPGRSTSPCMTRTSSPTGGPGSSVPRSAATRSQSPSPATG